MLGRSWAGAALLQVAPPPAIFYFALGWPARHLAGENQRMAPNKTRTPFLWSAYDLPEHPRSMLWQPHVLSLLFEQASFPFTGLIFCGWLLGLPRPSADARYTSWYSGMGRSCKITKAKKLAARNWQRRLCYASTSCEPRPPEGGR